MTSTAKGDDKTSANRGYLYVLKINTCTLYNINMKIYLFYNYCL